MRQVYLGLGWAGGLALVAGLFVLVWQGGMARPTGYLFRMAGPEQEAAYCLAVVERVREITRGQGEAALETHVDEQIAFWRTRTKGHESSGRSALGHDSTRPGVNEGAHLHLAIQDCAQRAVAFYGHRFALPQ